MRAIFAGVLFFGAAIGVAADTQPKRLAFDVVSVKPHPQEDLFADITPRRSGDRILMENAPFSSIIAWAYHLDNLNYQIIAGRWHQNLFDCYDVEALAPAGASDDDVRLMFQTMLAERFGMRAHRETRVLSTADLVVAKGGPKLHASKPEDRRVAFGGIASWVELRDDGLHLVGYGSTLDEMAVILTREVHAPVRNLTGITGEFNIDAGFSSTNDGTDKPAIATAIHELGLALVNGKAPLDVLVIDNLDKLSSN